eukprot:scaffold110937_cov36-Phaeocystis_antarctica.AAC.3
MEELRFIFGKLDAGEQAAGALARITRPGPVSSSFQYNVHASASSRVKWAIDRVVAVTSILAVEQPPRAWLYWPSGTTPATAK